MSSLLKKNSILLVNPWIHDFSAYDFWMKPLGLLYLGGILRKAGIQVSLLDCLDFSGQPIDLNISLKPPSRKTFGQGHFYKEIIPKPAHLQKVARHFRRYGIPPEVIQKILPRLPRPDLILMTSSMTYWYPGVLETIRFLKENIPGVPIFLGGIYATICFDHAKMHSGADRVLPGPWDQEKMKIVLEDLGESTVSAAEDFPSWPYPAFDLYRKTPYVCILTRCGCPFSCTYCAVSKLSKGFQSRNPEAVIEEIGYWGSHFGLSDFAFYDDALLIKPSEHILPILRGIIRQGIQCNFHTPNALHIQEIDEEVARFLWRAGFKTIRLGLETSNVAMQKETGGKVSNRDFQRAVKNLKKAGYAGNQIGVYLMAGLPGQRAKEMEESIAFVKDTGARPYLVEYSPIPGTALFEAAKKYSPFDIAHEPLFQNNSLLPCQWEGFSWGDFRKLKEKVRE
jgi:radical SAM superfamily enzyme YgiQ (UPF0313 family)